MGKRTIGILSELMVIALLLFLFVGVVLTAAGFRPTVRKPDTLAIFNSAPAIETPAAVATGDLTEER